MVLGKPITIAVTVPFGTGLTALIPVITVSTKATVLPNDGMANDFTNPVIYTVTAENGTKQDYMVTVKAAANSNDNNGNASSLSTINTVTTEIKVDTASNAATTVKTS